MSWQLFDRIAAFTKQARLYRRDNLYTDQSDLNRLTSGGQFLNFGHQAALLEQTNLQINRLERYKDFDQMDQVGAISLALDLYGDEASLIDPEIKHAITFKSKSIRVKEALEDFFYNTLMIDNVLRPMIRYLCKYGDYAAEIIPAKNRTGVANIKFMNIYNFTRVETRYGDLVGFFFQDHLISEPLFLHPWQVMHLRLTSYENTYHPYGRSILDGARKHFKQLRLMEDAALIYRITRAPEKRVFTIPVGNIPPNEVPQYIELIARQFKKKRFFDPATGDVNERWNPLIQEDDFWLPQRANGEGPQITTLPGAENLDDIKDIEYFKKNMISGLKIPFSRVGLGESGAGDERSLSQVSPEFAKAVQHIQREVAVGLKKIAIVHLALMGYAEEELRDFEVVMTASSAIDELYRIETWQSRANVIESLRGTEMFPNKWLLRRFTDMTDDEIDQMEEEQEKAKAAMPDMGMGGGGMGGMGGGMGGLGAPPPLPPGEPMPIGDLGIPGMEGAEGGAEGMGGLEGAEGTPPAMPALPEGYNRALEKLLMEELAKSSKPIVHNKPKSKRPLHLEEVMQTYSNSKLNSNFDYYLNHNELDGLSRGESDNDILIESILDNELRTEAINTAKMMMVEPDTVLLESEEDITSSDLPLRMTLIG